MTNQFVFDHNVKYKKKDPVYVINGKLSLIPNGKKIGSLVSFGNKQIEIKVGVEFSEE